MTEEEGKQTYDFNIRNHLQAPADLTASPRFCYHRGAVKSVKSTRQEEIP